MLLSRALLAALVVGLATPARAQSDSAREALIRLEEVLTLRTESQALDSRAVSPIIVVSVEPYYEASRRWYSTEALATLVRVFGADALRFCEACMTPRTFVEEGRLELSMGGVDTLEVARLDETLRGTARAARTAAWLDETPSGVSLRLVDLRNGRVVAADAIDPLLIERAGVSENMRLAEELARRQRGDSITHAFADFVLYPRQHISIDWAEQWGDDNTNLSGFTISMLDPVLGLGGAYYRVVPDAMNLTIGGKLLVSVPTALVQSIADTDEEVIDRLLTAVVVVRVPIGPSNYGVTASLSSNGVFGIGVSLLNTSLLPILP